MMPSNCSVPTCRTDTNITRVIGAKVALFRFPKDRELRQEWISRCHRSGSFNVDNARICSLHFPVDAFERDLTSELLNLPPKLILKPNSVPTLNLALACSEERPVPINCTLGETDIQDKENFAKEYIIEVFAQLELEEQAAKQNKSIEKPTQSAEHQLELIYEEINTLKNENNQLKEQLLKQGKKLVEYKRKINTLQTQLRKEKKKQKPENIQQILVKFEKIFTPAQLKLILSKNKIVRWEAKDITNAFTLRYFSKRCYLFLRNNLYYPLPGISTLQGWASKSDLKPGVLSTVLKFLEIASKTMKTEEKLVVLSFDEVKVAETFEYDKKRDQIVGPHSQMQVVNIRSLFSRWKQPVFVQFDTKMTPLILNNIISKLYKVGIQVVACVSDCGGSNVGLWRDLGLSPEKSYIKHKFTGSNIYFFADAPHLLKLTRSWLLDTGFNMNDKIIDSSPIKDLIESTRTEISSCFKVNEEHIKCEGFKRQNVALAAQLMSHTVATALKRYKADDKLAVDTADFIELINNWFDLMNTYTPHNLIPAKAAYGQHLDEQEDILDNTYNTILNMRCRGKNTLQVFQKGMLMSINSLKGLYRDIRQTTNMTYLLTHRLNQDVLENLFSQLRTRGGLNDHPTPLNALYRLRMIILGKSLSIQNSNTIDKGDDEFVIAKILMQSGVQIGNSSDTSESNSHLDRSISVTTNINTNDHMSEEYLSGWIAKKSRKKLRKTDPHLGEQTNTFEEHTYSYPSWVKHLSFGGLIAPSYECRKLIKELNTEFLKCVGEGIILKRNVNKIIETNILKNLPATDIVILRTFIRQRIFIRISFLNFTFNKQKQDKNLKRRVQEIKQSHVSKKLKKIST